MKIAIVCLVILCIVLFVRSAISNAALNMSVAWLVENGVGAPSEEFKKRYKNEIKRKYHLQTSEKEE